MENLAKMAEFLAQMLYKVFDLIWSLEVPGTNIQLIFPLFLTLAVEFLMAIILGFGSQQVNLEKQRQYAVKNKGRLSAWGKAKKQIKPIKKTRQLKMFKLIIIFILITVLGLLAGSHFETLTNYISEGLANFQKFITSNLTILELFKPMARTFSQTIQSLPFLVSLVYLLLYLLWLKDDKKYERRIKMKKLLVKLFKKDNSKEKMPLKLKIKNSFKKQQWLKILLSIIFIFISLLICALTAIDTKWITGTSNEFNDFMNKQMVDFFGKFNSGIMLAGIFVFWWGEAIYFAIKFEKLIRFIIQKIRTKRALKNEIKQTH